jgi:hypothetical protein
MEAEVSAELTDEFLIRVARPVQARYLLRLCVLYGAIILLPVPFLALFAWRSLNWTIAVAVGFPLLCLIHVCIAASALAMRSTLAFFRKMPHRRYVYRISDDGVTMVNPLGELRLRWDMILELRRREEALLLFHRKSEFLILPTDAMTDPLREFIAHKVTEAGGKVR